MALNLAWNKNKLHKTMDYWPKDMCNFDFLEIDLGIVFPPHFVYDFLTKIFLMFYSVNWPNFNVSLPLLHEIFCNMCIAIACFPGFDVISFEINFIFLIKPFFYMTKKSRQKPKYPEIEKSFLGETKIKSIFHHFWRAFTC